jgi:hypothetical protein
MHMEQGLAYWHDAFARQLTLNDYMLLASHPCFADASRKFLADSLARNARFPWAQHALRDFTRSLYAFLVMYVHVRGGITLTRVQEVCSVKPLASPGRAAAILALMKRNGFIRPDPGQNSRRERRYIPDPEFERVLRITLHDGLAALAVVEPEAAAAAERLDEEAFFRAFLVRFGELILMVRETMLGTSFFSERDAGQHILYDILLSAQPGDDYPPKGQLKVSIKDLSRRYGVSRAHVFRMFRDAEHLGILVRDAKTQTAVLSEPTRIAVAGMTISALIGHASCAEYARRATAPAAKAMAAAQ